MSSKLFLYHTTLYHIRQCLYAIPGIYLQYDCGNNPNAGVDEVDLRYAFSLPVSPVSLPPVREPGSYRLPALKQGKAKLLFFTPG